MPGCAKIFTDKVSGKLADRPELGTTPSAVLSSFSRIGPASAQP